MIPEQALEHGAQIDGRLEVTRLVKLSRLQSRPVGNHAPTPQSAAGEERDGALAVVRAIGAVDARGAAELRDDGNHRLAPGIAHTGLDGGKSAIERAQQIGELARSRPLVDMRIPSDIAERADARPVRSGEK